LESHTGTVKDLGSILPEKQPPRSNLINIDGDTQIDTTECTPKLLLLLIPNSNKPVLGGGPALFNMEQGDINRKAYWSSHLWP
jgi:hypothetical protein